METLYENGFDTSIRLAPFLYDTADYDIINTINCDKCLVEFLRVTPAAKKELSKIINLSEYTHREGNAQHLPLETKIQILDRLNFKELSVCDDVQQHYDYFLHNVCHNPNDCCNLTL